MKPTNRLRFVEQSQPNEPVAFKQFLSDVHTAAGLVTHGKQCKALGERLSEGVMRYMATPPAAPASWMEMVTANLVREGIGKHKARELAEHFYGLAQPSPCTWTQSPDPSTPDTYSATCGAMWTFTEGGPADNDMHFCPKCGSKVVEGSTS